MEGRHGADIFPITALVVVIVVVVIIVVVGLSVDIFSHHGPRFFRQIIFGVGALEKEEINGRRNGINGEMNF